MRERRMRSCGRNLSIPSGGMSRGIQTVNSVSRANRSSLRRNRSGLTRNIVAMNGMYQ